MTRTSLLSLLGLTALSGCSPPVASMDVQNPGDVSTSDLATDTASDVRVTADIVADQGGDARADDVFVAPDAGAGADVGAADVATDAQGDASASCTFTEIRDTILPGCSGFRCHHAPDAGFLDPSGGLDLSPGSAYGDLVGVPSAQYPPNVLVIPGDPDNSFLYRKLENLLPADMSEGLPMPQGEGIRWDAIRLQPPQIELIRCWITAGALDN